MKTIVLTEQDIKSIVKETVNEILNEGNDIIKISDRKNTIFKNISSLSEKRKIMLKLRF